MKTVITLPQLQTFLTKEIELAYSKKPDKSLVVTLEGTLKVKLNDKVIWKGKKALGAVNAYNSILE